MLGNIFEAAAVGLAVLGLRSFKRPVRRFAILFVALALGLVGDLLRDEPWLALCHGVLAVLCALALAGDVSLRTARRRNAILDYLAERPQGAYGLDLCRALRVGSGSLYPPLWDLVDDGAVRSWWDEESQPLRRLFALAEQEGADQ